MDALAARPSSREVPEKYRLRVSSEFEGLSLRMSQWINPYFSYWDEARGQPVVIPYEKPDSLCLPLAQSPNLFACPKGHP